MFDFGTINLQESSDKGASCHLNDPIYGMPLFLDPQKKKDPVEINVAGRDGRIFRDAMNEVGEMEFESDDDLSETDKRAIEILIRCIKGWKNVIWGGEQMEFNLDNARKLLTAFPPIRSQLDLFISKRANFFKEAETA